MVFMLRIEKILWITIQIDNKWKSKLLSTSRKFQGVWGNAAGCFSIDNMFLGKKYWFCFRRKLEEESERQKEEEKRLSKIKLQLELEQKKAEEAARKRAEEERKRQAIQEKLKQISPCPAGFTWHKEPGGWRCAGGSHFVSDKELNDRFTY